MRVTSITQVAYGYMRLYLSDETNRERRDGGGEGGGGQEMREGKRGRMNLNLRTSVVSPNRRADGAICRDVSSLSLLPPLLSLPASLPRCLRATAALMEQLNHSHPLYNQLT